MAHEQGHCYNCGYKGRLDWFWLILNDSNGKCESTHCLEPFDVEDGDRTIEVDYCPNCEAEQ